MFERCHECDDPGHAVFPTHCRDCGQRLDGHFVCSDGLLYTLQLNERHERFCRRVSPQVESVHLCCGQPRHVLYRKTDAPADHTAWQQGEFAHLTDGCVKSWERVTVLDSFRGPSNVPYMAVEPSRQARRREPETEWERWWP